MKLIKKLTIASCLAVGLYFNVNAQATQRPESTADNAQSNGDIKKGWDGVVKGHKAKCPDYLDCSTGEIQYFEYKKDIVVDAPEVCGPLGVKACIILKGRCDVDRSSKNGATVTLACKPFQCSITKPFAVQGTNPKGENCKGPGNSCFYISNPVDNNDQSFKLIITPIFDNGVCVALKITFPPNKSGRGTDPIQAGF